MIINSPSNKSQIRSFNMYTRTIISFDSFVFFFFFFFFFVTQNFYLCAPEYVWPWINCVLFQRPFETLEKSVIQNVINFLFKLFSLSPFILSSAHIRMCANRIDSFSFCLLGCIDHTYYSFSTDRQGPVYRTQRKRRYFYTHLATPKFVSYL